MKAASPARALVVAGPSGVGKGTLIAKVLDQAPQIWVSVSVTTRSPRPGETDGVHYLFVDDATFDRMAAQGELLEWAEFAGNRYGTPRAPIQQRLASGIPVLLEIELAGARQVRVTLPDALQVFIAPPSVAELERRLTGRATEDTRVVAERLRIAEGELAAQGEFDAVVVNDDVEAAAARLVALVMHAGTD